MGCSSSEKGFSFKTKGGLVICLVIGEVSYCQALVPSPVPLDQIPNPKKSQIQKPNWDWGDTKITRLR